MTSKLIWDCNTVSIGLLGDQPLNLYYLSVSEDFADLILQDLWG